MIPDTGRAIAQAGGEEAVGDATVSAFDHKKKDRVLL
jgi:hypothetical protein